MQPKRSDVQLASSGLVVRTGQLARRRQFVVTVRYCNGEVHEWIGLSRRMRVGQERVTGKDAMGRSFAYVVVDCQEVTYATG